MFKKESLREEIFIVDHRKKMATFREDMVPREDGRLHCSHTQDAKHELKVLQVYKALRTNPH